MRSFSKGAWVSRLRSQRAAATAALLILAFVAGARSADLPNVLWITLEDTSPHFIGCYGNEAAKTPRIDALAARGIRFDRAFANAPVCSSARSTIITGALNETLGTGNHRSAFPLPDHIKGFPTFLREAGYHTTNNKKKDYATSSETRLTRESWNASSGKAGWESRGNGQPFFSVFNVEHCHQSRTMTWSYDWYRRSIFRKLPVEARIADDAFEIPPFMPDTPECRKHFARVYNSISMADREVGRILDRLDADGLTDDTVIFCYADHGEAMLRGKANPIGLGYRVPFIIVFPGKWQHLNPWGQAGTVTDELVCFDDLGPTMLSLVGRKPAPWMTGRPILGKHRAAPRPYVYCARNRIDDSRACARSITDGRFLYTRHFVPGPEFRPEQYFDVAGISRLMRRAHATGKLNKVQNAMFQPQPHEVLYDLKNDRWETRNLSGQPEQAPRLAKLRTRLMEHIVKCRDVMLRPEFDLARISQDSTPYQYGAGAKPAELAAILDAADRASRPEIDPDILKLAKSDIPVVTYWAATALRTNPAYKRDGLTLSDFPYPPAAIEFAAARFMHDGDPAAADFLRKHALSDDPHLRLHALQCIQDFGAKAVAFKDTLEEATRNGTYGSRSSAEMTLHLFDQRPITYPDPKW